ncbi:MAG: hypothetical protein RL417_684 [Pseudomonadota bacterium]|jgi:hypothetical protein
MKKLLSIILALVIGLPMLAWGAQASTKSAPPGSLSAAELQKVVAPIALYPDLLLQQVLAASTFPEQILDAALYNEQGKAPEGIKNQPWDDSVKAVANYPSILVKLASDLDWTISLGSAFINQNDDLRTAIQTLRAKAKTIGNLQDSDYQNVIEESKNGTTIIRIEPVQSNVVYVPTTTTTVYESSVNTASLWAPVASFGLGMALGYAIGDNDDHYYYGGFYGPGFWYGGPAVNNWIDYRHDRWDDAYDFANDRQDWRQDNRDDWREYRQDLGRKQQEWRQAEGTRPADLSPEKRAEARSRATTAKSNWQAQSPDARVASLQSSELAERARTAGTTGFDRESANARLNQARSNQAFQERAAQLRSDTQFQDRARSFDRSSLSGESFGSAGAGLSGVGRSGNAVNRAAARGSFSRAGAGGFSRGGGGRRR